MLLNLAFALSLMFDPAPRLIDGPSPTAAIAPARDGGYVLAWAARNDAGKGRIFVAHLDRGAALIPGTTYELSPASDPTSDENHPAIATDGNNFVVAWIERLQGTTINVGAACLLDANGVPSRPSRGLYTTAPDAPRVAWNGERYLVTTSSIGFPFTRDFQPLTPEFLGSGRIDLAVHGRDVSIASAMSESHPDPYCGSYGYRCFHTNIDVFALALTFPRGRFVRQSSYMNPFGAAMAAARSQYLVVYPGGPVLSDFDLIGLRFDVDGIPIDDLTHPFLIAHLGAEKAYLPDFDSPRLAADGDSYFLVYQAVAPTGDHDVLGAFITGDGKVEARVTIAATSADERRPLVLRVGPGVFLAMYEVPVGEKRMLVTQFIERDPRRRRPGS